MFQSSIYSLPSCASYEGAKRIWERAPIPRNKTKWPVNTRPLDDSRKTHYAIIKDGDAYFFRLYHKAVVVWRSPTHLTFDSSFDSISTRDFALRFLPAGINFANLKHARSVVKTNDGLITRGIHDFQLGEDRLWHCTSRAEKPQRLVLDPVKRKEIATALKPLTEWVKGVWAVSGADGTHPWLNKEADVTMPPRYDLVKLAAGDIDEMEKILLANIPRHTIRSAFSLAQGTRVSWVSAYSKVSSSALLAAVRRSLYINTGAYIAIDYDAPLPKLEK